MIIYEVLRGFLAFSGGGGRHVIKLLQKITKMYPQAPLGGKGLGLSGEIGCALAARLALRVGILGQARREYGSIVKV